MDFIFNNQLFEKNKSAQSKIEYNHTKINLILPIEAEVK